MDLGLQRVLAIETSCDDSSVAIVNEEGIVETLVLKNQDVLHKDFGGVVPEVASRSHSDWVIPLIEEALIQSGRTWSEIDAIAVTSRPGLLGALMVGVVTAKTLAFSLSKPLIAINHLEGHLMAGFLTEAEIDRNRLRQSKLSYPFLALTVSGGHTQICLVHDFGQYQVIGKSRDDAAGEAFDKFAKLIGLGYPGGALVDKAAKKARESGKYRFPIGLAIEKETLDFSFSGLKSSAVRLLADWPQDRILKEREILAHDFQEAVVEALMIRLRQAQQQQKIQRVLITGGVSANSRLRSVAASWAESLQLELFIPHPKFCTDNAAMIGWAGIEKLKRGQFSDSSLSPSAKSLPGDFLES